MVGWHGVKSVNRIGRIEKNERWTSDNSQPSAWWRLNAVSVRRRRRLNYAQSTVTAHIQALETDLDAPLFNRLDKRIELTEAGLRLLEYSERLLDLAEETRIAVSNQQTLSGTLTIGAPETVSTYRLPQILRDFRDAMPDVRLKLPPIAIL